MPILSKDIKYINIVQVTPEVLSTTEMLSTSAVKRSTVGQGIKREWQIRSCKSQRNSRLQVFLSKLRVASYELKLELQFTKKHAESHRVNLDN